MKQVGSAEAKPLEVLICGDECLRRKSSPIDEVTPEVRRLAARMVATMMDEPTRGIGLAAPQVGENIRLVALCTVDPPYELPPNPSPGEVLLCPRMPVVLVNPRILWSSPERSRYTEGCLSVPEVFGDVIRPQRVVLGASTLDGESVNVECGGLLARCVQHEIDHLDGVLFFDRMDEESARELAPQIRELERIATRRARKHRNSV